MKPKLLIIDELSEYFFFLEKVLINIGYEVSGIDVENEIFEYLNMFLPDIILIDVQMNNGKGFIFLKKIKYEINVAAPVIVISSCKNIKEIEKAFNYGVYDYLIKPLNLNELTNRINKALEK